MSEQDEREKVLKETLDPEATDEDVEAHNKSAKAASDDDSDDVEAHAKILRTRHEK
jgi:hypothetical protein